MKARLFIPLLAGLLAWNPADAVSPREEIEADHNRAGGAYYAYNAAAASNSTKAPKGYRPFFIYEFGRHGSRYIGGSRIDQARTAFASLKDASEKGGLTDSGRELYDALVPIFEAHDGWDESLAPLGVTQQREIAGRMYRNYPEVFRGRAGIDARGTAFPRVILSMSAFCGRLKEINPKLEITLTAGQDRDKDCDYGANRPKKAYKKVMKKAVWTAEGDKYLKKNIHPERFAASVFTNPSYAGDPMDFMKGIFYWACEVQNMGIKEDLFRFFDEQSIYHLWVHGNFNSYCKQGCNPDTKPIWAYMSGVIRGIVKYADRAVSGEGPAAVLRFGHDSNIGPIAAMLHLSGATCSLTGISDVAQEWQSYNVMPMAANIQMVFFRNRKGEVIVKTSLNEIERTMPLESEFAPFYRWPDVKAMLENEASELEAFDNANR